MGKFKEYLQESEDLFIKITEVLDTMSFDELCDFGNFLYYNFFDDDTTTEDDYADFDRSDIDKMIHELGSDFYEEILDALDPEELETDSENEDEVNETNYGYIKYAGKKMRVKLLKLTKTGAIVSVDDPNFPKIKGKEFEIEDEELLESKKFKSGDKVLFGFYDADRNNRKFKGTIVLQKGNKVIVNNSNGDDRELDISKDYIALEEGISRRLSTKNMNKKKRKFMANSIAMLRKTKVQRRRENLASRAERKRYYKANKMKMAAYQKSRKSAIEKGKHFVKLRKKAGGGTGGVA